MISPTQGTRVIQGSLDDDEATKAPIQATQLSEKLRLPGPSGLFDWFSIQIRPETDFPPNTPHTPADPASIKYLEIYFSAFHHRWPIIHRPSFEQENEQTLVVSSVKMIGAWLLGCPESRAFAVTWHNALMEQLVPRLVSHLCSE